MSAKAERLVDHPDLGRPGRVSGTRELVAHHNDILIYDVVGDRVRVLRVLHTARQWPPLGERFRELDVPLLVEWPDGRREALLFVLEEETNPQRFSIHRLAHPRRAVP